MVEFIPPRDIETHGESLRSTPATSGQLSYCGFKRLSDRRRSGNVTRASNFIIFSHPSGDFLKGDAWRLNVIARKTRNRPEKRGSLSSAAGSKRNASRYSEISQDSYNDSDQVHLAQVANYFPEACWQHATNSFDIRYYDIHRTSHWCISLPPTSDTYSDDSRDELYASYTSNMGQLKLASYPQPPAPPTSYETFEDLRANAPIAFKIASMSLAPNAPHSLPFSLRRSSTSSPSFAESRTRLPKSPSQLFLPPIALTFNAPLHGEPLPSPNFYAHPYPTPESSPTTQTHFHLAQCPYQDAP
ncbi:hypothetical protein MVLG_05970 [Microbotryum lychnidis-dioicae p1A1 Lamole]|uniref:Uncharacterized protein n=1 Tax=Microbotryum lychnidis-dioicae (strain p1A1 Lamole / MvSl-1064) TaxID=683840 RepID=U5HFU4_USTV1|nr:hypothetical protein MVLG_05970 [Microbotryum lychnidis-dioicae p1A1 Lamole]|eukprot:KDE03542.1 hypothetical protein MVLG_05970 [Microbotryum lychnidis-dioicae p1A1 Lamole]